MLSSLACPVALHRASALPLVGLLLCACATTSPIPAAQVERGEDWIEFPATVSASGFDASDPAGYHLIVWEGGRAVHGSLFRSLVSDVQVIDALEALGAIPGDALGIDTWDQRDDPSATAPDKVIEGPRVELTVALPDGEPLRLDEMLEDPGGRGFDLRFGGHRDNIPEWHSGCVVCLYSCPGSKVGNASYTVRDFVIGTTHFRPREGILPADESPVRIRLRLLPEATP